MCVLASFQFVGYLNGHHQEWLGYTTTNRHAISWLARLMLLVEHLTSWWLMFLTQYGLLLYAPIVAQITSLLVVISMAKDVTNLLDSRRIFLKHKLHFNTICVAVQDLPWRNICSADILLRFWTNLSLLVGRYVPTKVIRVQNKDKPWFDDQCRHAFGLEQRSHLWWTRDRSRVNCLKIAKRKLLEKTIIYGRKFYSTNLLELSFICN